MPTKWIAIVVSLALHLAVCIGMMKERSITYNIKGVEITSSNEDLMKTECVVARLSRTEFGMTCTYDVNYDFKPETTFEVNSYRSLTGNSEYRPLPYSIVKQSYITFMNSFYKDSFMKEVKDCSNLPQFEDKFEPPMAKQKYYMEKCVVQLVGLPKDLPAGHYKVAFIVGGEVDWSVTFYGEIVESY